MEKVQACLKLIFFPACRYLKTVSRTQWRPEKPGDSLQKGTSPFAGGSSTKAQRGLFASFDGPKQRACRCSEVCHQAARGQQQPERWPWNGRSREARKALTDKSWCPGRIFHQFPHAFVDLLIMVRSSCSYYYILDAMCHVRLLYLHVP